MVYAAVPRCVREGMIVESIVLHTKRELTPLSKSWYRAFFRPQPLGQFSRLFDFCFVQHLTAGDGLLG